MRRSASRLLATREVTIAEALRDAAQQLCASSDTARLDAEVLMAHVLEVSRSDLLLRHMADAVPAGFAELLARRSHSEPIAHITGSQEFYGRNFRVTADVLIPRADSETIVEAALAASPRPRRVLDCGTGSGALLLSILAERTGARGVGVDSSAAALNVASANAAELGLSDRAEMLHASWNDPGWADTLGEFDLILANPPYVEDAAKLDASVRDFEPASALFSGPEGLDDYHALIPQLPRLLQNNGVAVLEIGAAQEKSVTQIAQNSGFRVDCHQDLAGRPRALTLHLR